MKGSPYHRAPSSKKLPCISNRKKSDPFTPMDSSITSFYPQSLWSDRKGGEPYEDLDRLISVFRVVKTPLVKGKYVPDPDLTDFSNPKFVIPGLPPRSSEEMLSLLEEYPTDTDEDVEEPEVKQGQRIDSYVMVEPKHPCSSGSLYFPVVFDLPKVKEKTDPRGTPKLIHETLHPADRKSMSLSVLRIQQGDANKEIYFKIAPGAVAFKVVIDAFTAAGMKYTKSNHKYNIIWAKRATPYCLMSMHSYQKINHFPGTWAIGRKDNLAVNVNDMKRYYGHDTFDIIPISFLLPRQQTEVELDAAHHPDTPSSPLIYILKPVASSCGRGISLCRGIPPPFSETQKRICQRYIGNPLLIFGRKFDLRLYCVVTSFDPLRIYVFDQGLVRFAAEKYVGPDKDLNNIQVHLTNYSVNKTAELYRSSQGKDHNTDEAIDIKWSLSDLQNYLKENHPDPDAWNKIRTACDDVVVKAFLSIETQVISRIRAECVDHTGRGCFEMFGLDLMTDDKLKVSLIEVNIMPSLATGSSLDIAVKTRMLAHMFTLIRCIPFDRAQLARDGEKKAFIPKGALPSRPERIYKFGKHPLAGWTLVEKPLLRSFNRPEDPDSVLSVEESLMLTESEEELNCAGGFRRIYPNPSTVEKYLPLFPGGVRRNNYLLASAILQKCSKIQRQ